jgi:hypothetical protein
VSTPKRKLAKSLDKKLAKIRSGKYTPTDFIIADAKDADMSVGLMAPATRPGNEIGASRPGIYRSRQEYLGNKKQ